MSAHGMVHEGIDVKGGGLYLVVRANMNTGHVVGTDRNYGH